MSSTSKYIAMPQSLENSLGVGVSLNLTSRLFSSASDSNALAVVKNSKYPFFITPHISSPLILSNRTNSFKTGFDLCVRVKHSST